VFSDALEMAAAAYDKDNPRVPKSLLNVSREAVLAGNNVLVYGQAVSSEQLLVIAKELAKEYESSPQFKFYVDQSVQKIIEYKYETN
jgi:hypothetical protein